MGTSWHLLCGSRCQLVPSSDTCLVGYELTSNGDTSWHHLWYELTSIGGTSWYGYELTWVRVDMGTSWHGYELTGILPYEVCVGLRGMCKACQNYLNEHCPTLFSCQFSKSAHIMHPDTCPQNGLRNVPQVCVPMMELLVPVHKVCVVLRGVAWYV